VTVPVVMAVRPMVLRGAGSVTREHRLPPRTLCRVRSWRERWASQPVWARWVLAAYLVGFADGTGAHVRDLIRGGLQAYAYAPAAAQVFFVALVLLDPVVFVLVLLMRPAGIWLAGAVMLADMAANWFVNWSAPPEYRLKFLPPVGLLPITLFGVFVLVSLIPLRRSLAARTVPTA
jgi:hypothetical protein